MRITSSEAFDMTSFPILTRNEVSYIHMLLSRVSAIFFCIAVVSALSIDTAYAKKVKVAPTNIGCVIKGNISAKKEKIYHLPGCASYSATVISPSKGERMFCSEKEARDAGWRKALNCPK